MQKNNPTSHTGQDTGEVDYWLEAMALLTQSRNEEREKLEAELALVTGSISWKLTSPIRIAKRSIQSRRRG